MINFCLGDKFTDGRDDSNGKTTLTIREKHPSKTLSIGTDGTDGMG